MRIVIGLDGSPSSLQARDLVATLPWPSGTTISLVTAIDIPAPWFFDVPAPADWLTATEDELRRQAADALTTLAHPLEGHGWTIERRVAEGRAATEIVAVAEEIGADLIVVGSRGRGPIKTMLLGSVSAEIVSAAPCSVLVARDRQVTRMLVATDGSACSAAIPGVLDACGTFRGVEAISLSVVPVDSPAFAMLVTLYTMGNEVPEPGPEDQHRGYAEEIARRLSDVGIPTTPEVRTGDPAHAILAMAAEHHADLIVTGSRCLQGVDRWILGSVARNVLTHAEASVLVVRPTSPGPAA